MTKARVACFLGVLLAAAGARAVEPRGKDALPALQGAFIEALGGKARVEAVTALTAEGEFKRRAGDGTISGRIRLALLLPDLFLKSRIESPAPGMSLARTWLYDGARTWALTQGKPTPTLDEDSLSELRRLSLLLLGRTAADSALSYAGEAKSPDGTALALDARCGADPCRLFLDPANHRPLMLSYEGQLLRGGTTFAFLGGDGKLHTLKDSEAATTRGTITVFPSDHRAVDGVLLPHKLAYSVNGTPMEEWSLKYRLDERLSPAQFRP